MEYRPTDTLDITLKAAIYDIGQKAPEQINPAWAVLSDPERFVLYFFWYYDDPARPGFIWQVNIAEAYRIAVPIPSLGEPHTYQFVYKPGEANQIWVDGVLVAYGAAPPEPLPPSRGELVTNVSHRMVLGPTYEAKWDIVQPPFPAWLILVLLALVASSADRGDKK